MCYDVMCYVPQGPLAGDLAPASFWSSTPTTIWRHNIAPGSCSRGYWCVWGFSGLVKVHLDLDLQRLLIVVPSCAACILSAPQKPLKPPPMFYPLF